METERIYSAFLVLLSEVDSNINSKGLKINPKEVMMNYVATPSRVLKTIQQSLYFINNSRISESNFYLEILYTSYSIFLNVSIEYLGLSKILYYYLLNIFEYCGLSAPIYQEKEILKESNTNTINALKGSLSANTSATSFTVLFRPTSFEADSGVLLTRKNLKSEVPKIKILSEDDTVSEEAQPPRISQKYLMQKKSAYRSTSVSALKLRHKLYN